MIKKQVLIAPSILSANLLNLGAEIEKVQTKADIIHIDVMDGHFVPNLSFGPELVSQIRKFTDKNLDVHLMLSQPQKYIDKFLQAGTDYLSFHIEVDINHTKWISKIKKSNCKAGIVLNPDTPIEDIVHLLDNLDYVLVMTVHPGYGGQSYIEKCTPKIRDLHKLQSQYDFLIEVDGGINAETAKLAKSAGADILVAGSFIFNNKDNYVKTIKDLRDV